MVYLNRNNDVKSYKAKGYYLPNGSIENYDSIIIGENVYDKRFDSDTKWYRKITKLTSGQGEDFTTGCFLDYYLIKNSNRFLAVDLNRPKELAAD